ncbi:PAS domain S-box-containing protein [Azospirillum agricola]|uniref:hybrid sensor histidine kinase/response regulator n=1 Tax=Azospirillum agricola TaxID=1720247 RepID=UPI001AE2AC72|nr:PAS domain-containing sensor histidine kinase [Azospirillum agricola]MBP2230869.1 PAS domain S-box-containing protein [Azospirillum agricola]
MDRHLLSLRDSPTGALVAAFDWSATSLGPITDWPRSLRTVVDLVVHSPVPMVLMWGPDHRMVYNDGYARIAGGKHPQALGGTVPGVWPEIWDWNRAILEKGFRGEVQAHTDHLFLLERNGAPEEVWCDLFYSPVPDESGRVAGVLCTVIETTARIHAMRATERSEERLRHALDAAAAVGVWDWDVGSGLVHTDAAYARLFSVDPAAAAAGAPLSNFVDGILPEDRDGVRRCLDAAMRDGRRFTIEYRLLSDGGMRWVSSHGRRLSGSEGAPPRISGVTVDITERKAIEEALRASENRLRRAQEAGRVGTFEVDIAGSTVTGSDMFFRLWGLEPMESAPAALFEGMLVTEDRALSSNDGSRAAGSAVTAVEYRIRRADTGEERWLSRHADFLRDGDGRPVRLVGTLHDVTERKRAETALRALNAELEARVAERTRERDRIWAVSQDLLCIADLDGVLLSVNPAWSRTLGWSDSEIVGRTATWMEHPDDHERSRRTVAGLAAGTPTLNYENRLRCRDGTYRWLSWAAVLDNDFVYGVARDITAGKERDAELERAREQLRQSQKMEAIGQLTGGIAHDFNNLLQAMSGCLQLIGRRAGERPGVAPLIDAGRQAVDRGARLVQQLMAFARKQSLHPEPFDLRDRLLGMTGLLERALRADIQSSMDLAAGLWAVEADPTQFELAVLNLAVNARDAMPGGGHLVIAACNVTLGGAATGGPGPDGLAGDFLRIRVTDTGTGMAPEVAAHAFEPFFTTKPVGKGTGLGLSQVYGFARQSGGTVMVDSAPGQGTTVTLLLPRATGNKAGGATGEPMAGDGAAPPGRGLRILMVEDDPLVAPVVRAALEEMGYTVAHAGSGHEALVRLRGGEPADLLFSDVVMPGTVSGVDLAREIRRLRPGLPVLLTTGYNEDLTGMETFRVLPKPYRIEDLGAIIEAELAAGRG